MRTITSTIHPGETSNHVGLRNMQLHTCGEQIETFNTYLQRLQNCEILINCKQITYNISVIRPFYIVCVVYEQISDQKCRNNNEKSIPKVEYLHTGGSFRILRCFDNRYNNTFIH